MLFHMKEESKFRHLIEVIDTKAQKEKIDNILKHKAYKTEHGGYFLIDRYDWQTLRFYGTAIAKYGQGSKATLNIRINEFESESDLSKSEKIPVSVIKKLLKEASDKISKLL